MLGLAVVDRGVDQVRRLVGDHPRVLDQMRTVAFDACRAGSNQNVAMLRALVARELEGWVRAP